MGDELVSGAEIGRRLGVSRETVRKWAKQPTKGFPEPLARVGRSVVWNWTHVARWAELSGIRKRGVA